MPVHTSTVRTPTVRTSTVQPSTSRLTVARRAIVAALTIGCAASLAACGDDAGAAADGVLEVTMADFHYRNLPDEIPVGTRLAIANTSTTELHELVAFRLPESDDRTVAEILAGDLAGLLGGTPPAMVLLAAPGGEQIAAVGDGTLEEPGRYLLLCAIPTGADPDEYLAAAATSDGPPQVAGGPPHFAHGMADELIVTG